MEVLGDVEAAAALSSYAAEVVAGESFVLVDGHRLVLIREGQPDADGLAARIELATRMAATLG